MEEQEFVKSYMSLVIKLFRNPEQKRIYGVTKGELGIMTYIYKHNNIANPGELIERFGVGSGRIANALKNLEKKGLVIRENDAKDKRKTNVSLTENGLNIAKKVFDNFKKKMSDLFLVLGEDDAKEFIRILEKICREMEEKNV